MSASEDAIKHLDKLFSIGKRHTGHIATAISLHSSNVLLSLMLFIEEQKKITNEIASLALDVSRFEWMLKTQASVYHANDSDWFICQFKVIHFTCGKTEREAIDIAIKEYAILNQKNTTTKE